MDGARHPGFWEFALNVAAEFGDSDRNPKNLVWSNVFKIGSETGDPGIRSTRLQNALAIETLKLEIKEYRPQLVLFCPGFEQKYEDVIYEVAGREDQGGWVPESVGSPEESWALAKEGNPLMLWIKHPARKPSICSKAWLARARSYFNGDQKLSRR